MKTTIKDLANRLNRREYGSEITPVDEADAKESGLVIVFGYSDDIMEIAGAWGRDEFYCWRGSEWKVDANGILSLHDEEEDPSRAINARHSIRAIWCPDEELSWSYETSFPDASFMILENGRPYCRGIVFKVDDIE